MSYLARTGLVVCLAAGWCQAQVSDFSGLWNLNVAKSSWGRKQKPHSVSIEIEHREPALKYHGTVVDTHGDGRYFSFEGAIDGKEYRYQGPYGEGAVRLQRVDSRTVSSAFTSTDGKVMENITMRLSRDGRSFTYQVRLRDPGGEMSWTEVYEKK